MKLFFKSLGVFVIGLILLMLLAIAIASVSPKLGETFTSLAPIAAIGATVGYWKDQRAKTCPPRKPSGPLSGAGKVN